MEKYFYQNYVAVFTSNYVMSDFIKDHELESAEIAFMFQGDKVSIGGPDYYYEYMMVFKIPISHDSFTKPKK